MTGKGRAAAAAALGLATLCLVVPAQAMDLQEAVDQLASQIAQVAPESTAVRIAITDFTDSHGVTSDFSRYVADRLIRRLALNPRLMVIERRLLGQVLQQLGLKRSDLARPEGARLLAKGYGVDLVVLASATELGDQISLDARVVDVLSGETIGYASANVTRDAKVGRMLEVGRQQEPR